MQGSIMRGAKFTLGAAVRFENDIGPAFAGPMGIVS
jgi:hypothetical protein